MCEREIILLGRMKDYRGIKLYQIKEYKIVSVLNVKIDKENYFTLKRGNLRKIIFRDVKIVKSSCT